MFMYASAVRPALWQLDACTCAQKSTDRQGVRCDGVCVLAQALAAAIMAFGFLYLRRLYAIRPDAVYRSALLQLNTNPGILEVGHPGSPTLYGTLCSPQRVRHSWLSVHMCSVELRSGAWVKHPFGAAHRA